MQLLRGLKKEEVERGQVLAKPGSITPHTEFEGEIYVLTPNKAYLDRCKNENYVADPTVVKHFYIGELIELFHTLGFCVAEARQVGKKIGVAPERIYIKAVKS